MKKYLGYLLVAPAVLGLGGGFLFTLYIPFMNYYKYHDYYDFYFIYGMYSCIFLAIAGIKLLEKS